MIVSQEFLESSWNFESRAKPKKLNNQQSLGKSFELSHSKHNIKSNQKLSAMQSISAKLAKELKPALNPIRSQSRQGGKLWKQFLPNEKFIIFRIFPFQRKRRLSAIEKFF